MAFHSQSYPHIMYNIYRYDVCVLCIHSVLIVLCLLAEDIIELVDDIIKIVDQKRSIAR